MNEITKQAVENIAMKNQTTAKKAIAGEPYQTERMNTMIREEYNSLVFGLISWKIRARAEDLFQLFRPDFFSTDEETKWLTDDYFDHACFCPMIRRIIDRHLGNHPELQLADYTEYLAGLFPEQLKMF